MPGELFKLYDQVMVQHEKTVSISLFRNPGDIPLQSFGERLRVIRDIFEQLILKGMLNRQKGSGFLQRKERFIRFRKKNGVKAIAHTIVFMQTSLTNPRVAIKKMVWPILTVGATFMKMALMKKTQKQRLMLSKNGKIFINS